MLRVENLVTAYGKIKALRGVTLEAREGEVTCLLGPNGAGKTTTMFSIAGILRPTSGDITLDGESLRGLGAARVVGKGVALVPENRLVFPQMTVSDNLHAGAFSRRDDRKRQRDMEKIYQRFPVLRERSRQPAGTLSGGEQQMLAIARALMARPRILLMDEPSIGLAPIIVAEIFRIIAEINREGVSILLVEQNAHMALKFAHRLYLIQQGEITFSGTPDELGQDEVIQRSYLGG
ncbi:MAG: ABC transporter ATP-binding protein [Gammaproteobacteria bacterium]|nr:ABC transporter ATP-binding protein [Gammaproteobacteria bacterium]MDD9814495.1 ABC transporter ATP-binding protein [Gammaproteobacteria bacterium]